MFVFCSIAALSAPRAGKRLVREFHRGADIVLAYDISRSMDIRDFERGGVLRSRLERGVQLGKALVRAETGGAGTAGVMIPADIHIRFALALGKGSAFLAVPLTSDTEAVFALLDSLSSSSVSSRGTNLEALLDAAVSAFNDTFSTTKVVILFSDGEALAGSLSDAAKRAREQDITVYTVGLGSVEGSPLESGGGGMEPRSFLHPEALAAAASLAGGEYLDGNDASAQERLENIGGLAGGTSWNFREEFVPVWHLFVLAALAALLLSRLCDKRPRKKPPAAAGAGNPAP